MTMQKIFLKKFVLAMSLWAFFLPSAYATVVSDEAHSEEIQTLFGQACERIKPQETISSIRMRATDKATFEAVKNLESIAPLTNEFDEHDLNVLIYQIVDNYVEDLGVQTTQQNEQKICVEVTGYVTSDNIFATLDELKKERVASSEIKMQETVSAPIENEPSPEKPATTIEPDISQTNNNVPASSLPEENVSSQTISVPSSKLLYIAPVEFFNNTKSKEYAKILNRVFANNAYFQLTENENAAGYIILSKILRAKVDAINSNTNRMQMVVSVEVKNKIDGSSAIEHQNRFILFKSSEEEQKVAANLMQKLLTKAAHLILSKVERMAQKYAEESGDDESAFITPKKTSLAPLSDVEKSEIISK